MCIPCWVPYWVPYWVFFSPPAYRLAKQTYFKFVASLYGAGLATNRVWSFNAFTHTIVTFPHALLCISKLRPKISILTILCVAFEFLSYDWYSYNIGCFHGWSVFFSSYDMFCAVLLTSSEYWQSRALNYRCNYSLRDSLMTWRQKIVAQKKEV